MKPCSTDHPILFSPALIPPLLNDTKTCTRRIATNLRVVPRRRVTADFPFIMDQGSKLVVEPGKRYPAHLNPQGAVSAVIGDEKLGLKPDEFDFTCPFATGKTVLGYDHKWRVLSAGDTLWVREGLYFEKDGIQNWFYKADNAEVLVSEESPYYLQMVTWAHHKERDYCPGIHMPRFASRITLQVLNVRLEKLQSITEEEAKAEGVQSFTERFGGTIGQDQCLTSGERAYDSPFRSGFAVKWDELNDQRATWKSDPWVWTIEFRRVL